MRLMRDTNLWSYIGDADVADSFADLAMSRSWEIVVAPSLLVQVLGIPVVGARQRIIQALADASYRKLRTEAESEAADLVEEIRRVKPEWIRAMPDTAKVHSLSRFWTRRIWRQAVRDSSKLHELQAQGKHIKEYLVGVQKQQRSLVLESKFDMRPLTALMVESQPSTPPDYLAGWSGAPTEAWRLASRDLYWRELVEVAGRALLTSEDTTIADWVGAYVNLALLRKDRTGFTRMWLDEVSLRALPREWVRWAVRLVQSGRKVTGGNPVDEQHSSYLVDCDLFLTADFNYAAALDVVRADAPFTMAEARFVPGGPTRQVVDRIADVT